MRYRVVERRISTGEYIIEAESAEAAGRLDGDIIEESESESTGFDLLSVDEVDESASL